MLVQRNHQVIADMIEMSKMTDYQQANWDILQITVTQFKLQMFLYSEFCHLLALLLSQVSDFHLLSFQTHLSALFNSHMKCSPSNMT